MPLPSSINDLSTTPASNSPAGSESPTLTDDYLRYYASYIAALRDVVLSGTASLTTLNLAYTGTLTGGTGVVNIGTGQIYKDASGLVGIGGTPTYTLDLVTANARLAVRPSTGTNAALAQFVNTGGTAYSGIDSSTGAAFGAAYALTLWHGGAYPITFGTSGAERMRIDSSGNVGIGRTPTVKLDVNGPMALAYATLVSTGTYTVLTSDAALRFNSGACVLTLPSPGSFPGRILRVFQCLGSGGAITSASSNVYPQGGAALGTAILAATTGKWADLQSDGTSWWITASN
jgi:hypothetical protein